MSKKTEETKEVVAVGGSVALAPSFMQGLAGQGMEGLNASDIEIPRIKLLQGISPELMEFPDAKQGHFFHNVAELDLGEKLNIVPLYIWKMFILWNPRESGGGILARAEDGVHWSPPNGEFDVKINKGTKSAKWKLAPTVAASQLDQWGTYDPSDLNSQPAATRMFNIVAYLPDHPDLSPVVITMQRSSIKVARRFAGKLQMTQAPSYGRKFIIGPVQDQNKAGDKFWNYAFTSDGFVESEEQFNFYKSLYEQFKASGVKIRDIDGLADDDTPAEGKAVSGDGGGDF